MTAYNDEYKAPEKQSVYMAIRGGHKVYLGCPVPEDFDPVRTAWALAHEHRYGGNYGPYSVAQHAVLVCETVERLNLPEHDGDEDDQEDCVDCRQERLSALHHDDTESILGDLPQPVKSLCPDFKALERRLEAALDTRYDTCINSKIVKEADRIVFCAEVRCLVPAEHQHLYGEYGNPEYRRDMQPDWEDMAFWTPDEAAKRYLQLHTELTE